MNWTEEYARRKQLGLCVKCKDKLPDGWTMSLCPVCREKSNEYLINRRERLKQQGLCRCGKAKPEQGHTLCTNCIEMTRVYVKRHFMRCGR